MSTKVFIPQPCHENWVNMSQVEKGRFCKVCEKKVVDFTKDSKEDIVKYLSEKAGGTCGRFREDQLDETPRKIRNNKIWMRIGAVAASLATIFSFKSNMVQGGTVLSKEDLRKFRVDISKVTNSKAHKLELKVLDTLGSSIPNATIYVSSASKMIAKGESDLSGKLNLTIPPGFLSNSMFSLDIHTPSFRSFSMKDISTSGHESKIEIKLSSDEEIGEIQMADLTLINELEMDEQEVFLGGTIAVQKIEDAIVPTDLFQEEYLSAGVVMMMGAPMIEVLQMPIFEINEEEFLQFKDDTMELMEPIDIEKLDLDRSQMGQLTLEPISKDDPDLRQKENEKEPEKEGPPFKDDKALKPDRVLLRLYPNPTVDILNIILSKKMLFTFQVFTANGTLVEEGTLNKERFQLSMNNRPNGTYILKIISKEKLIASERFIVSK